MNRGLLIILSGPSGVGKGTIRKKLFENNDLNLVYSISMTTRAPRAGEKDGVDYFFVSEKEFQKNINKNNFLEFCFFVGNCYGTPKSFIEKWRNEGKNVFLEIEINGASQVLEKTKGDGVVSIFLTPPSFEALKERIINRKSETEEVVNKRLAKAKSEMDKVNEYDYVVINDDVERAAEEIRQIIINKINNQN